MTYEWKDILPSWTGNLNVLKMLRYWLNCWKLAFPFLKKKHYILRSPSLGYLFCSGFITSIHIHMFHSHIHNIFTCFPLHVIKGVWRISWPSTVFCQCRHISPFKLNGRELGTRSRTYFQWGERNPQGHHDMWFFQVCLRHRNISVSSI